jgi:hypothetical protein
MKQIPRTAASDLRRLRVDLKAKISKLAKSRYSEMWLMSSNRPIDPLVQAMQPVRGALVSVWDDSAETSKPALLKNRLVGSSAQPSPSDRGNRDRSDCRGSNAADANCQHRLSPPCIAWGTPSCGRSSFGAPLAVDDNLTLANE